MKVVFFFKNALQIVSKYIIETVYEVINMSFKRCSVSYSEWRPTPAWNIEWT